MTPLINSQYAIWTLSRHDVIDLIAATTNAFNGALLARRPDHYKHFTVAGILLLAFVGGIGGGVIRDVLVNKVPTPLENPWFLIACFIAAGLALLIDYYSAQRFRAGLFAFATSFSLPWYAIVGAQAAVSAHMGFLAAILIGVLATTSGRIIIDISCQVVPKVLVRGEYFVLSAVLTAVAYLVLREALGVDLALATGVAVIVGFGFRLMAQMFGWEEFEPWEPAAVTAGEKQRDTLWSALHDERKPGQ